MMEEITVNIIMSLYIGKRRGTDIVKSCKALTHGTWHIREYDSTLYVGMVQGVSNLQCIGIGTKLRKVSKTAKMRLCRAKYKIFIH